MIRVAQQRDDDHAPGGRRKGKNDASEAQRIEADMQATFARRSVLLGGLAFPVANILPGALASLLVEDGAIAAVDWQGSQPETYIERLKRRFANALIREARDEPVEALFAARGGR